MRLTVAIIGIGVAVGIIGLILYGAAGGSTPMNDAQTPSFDTVQANGLALSSSVLTEGGDIPLRYTCDGNGINPPLTFSGVADDAQSLVLLMDDPDAPIGTFDHWVVYNMASSTASIEDGEEPANAVLGVGSTGETGYQPPCPPGERHRYIFTLYSLDAELSLAAGADKSTVLNAMDGHVLQRTQLLTYYER